MSRRALGRHWRARTPAERREFVALFTDLLERSYLTRIESGRGGKVVYIGATTLNAVIQSSSYPALVERLRSKETDAAASPASPRRSRRD